MSAIRLPGLQSGIDTATLIQQLMAVESRRLNTYENRKTLWEEREDALSTLEAKLRDLRNSARALSDAEDIRAYTVATSDNEKLTAEASNNAFEGNHTVVINQLAGSDRWVHTNGLEYAEDYVGEGTFIYSYDDQETAITTTATTTLEDLVGLINNDANNPGVTAGLLYYNDAYHLVLNGNDAGSGYRISVNASSTEVWEADSVLAAGGDNAVLSTKITDLDQFSGALEGGEVIEITGTDHYGNTITQVNVSVTENTKLSHLIGEINDAFEQNVKAILENGEIIVSDSISGSSSLSIVLTYNGNGSAATLTLPAMAVSAEGGDTTASLANFAASDFTTTQSAQDSKIKIDGYPSASAVAEMQQLDHTQAATSGTFRLSYAGQTTEAIGYNAGIAEIQDALDALSNVSDGDIVVGGQTLDTSGTLTFTFSDTLGDVGTILVDCSALSDTYLVIEQTKGVDAWISRNSNTVDNVIHGVTLHLHDTTDAGGEDITLTRDIQSVKSKLESMVTSYNAAVEYIQEKTAYDKATKTAGVLMGDYVVRTLKYNFRGPLVENVAGFSEDLDAFLNPLNIGLELDRDGRLSLDANAFDEAIAENYRGVLAVIGANKTGNSDSNTIEFYGANATYTTAGEYDVQVTVSGGAITSARIKRTDESTYRDAAYSGNIVTGDTSFDSNGDPVYGENGLQLSVDLGTDGTFTARVRVKQGFAGKLENQIDRMVRTTTGSILINKEQVKDQIEGLEDKIEQEQDRLSKKEARLVARFARLEKMLALLDRQMAAAGLISYQGWTG